MHCCLITAPTITEYRHRGEWTSEAVQTAALEPQLGPLSVAAVLEQVGDRPAFVDANAVYLHHMQASHGGDPDNFAEELAGLAVRSHADVYGFSSICSTYPLSLRVAKAIKQLRPRAIILFGGPQASVVDVATMEAFPFVDFILRGEVEKTLPMLFEEWNGGSNFARVGGLTFRDGGQVRRNANAPVIEDLDDLPAPAYHLSEYLKQSKSASIELGRGCPFSCTFCSTNDFFRRNFRLRSPGRVLAAMRAIAAKHGTHHFELVHDMFTVDRKRVVAFCEEMLHSGECFTWDCSARTDCVDGELLELMSRSGCRGVFFGIETGSRRMQRLIDKDLDPVRAEQMLDAAQRLGIRTTASFITGFPGEEWADVQDTMRLFIRSARCALSLPQLNLLAPLAGTPIHAAHRAEMVLEDLCSDMSHQGLSQSEDDLRLIQAHPDIFPNFYLIPVPGLARDLLLELREFVTAAVLRFRWLLCAVDRTTDLLQLVFEWRAWRMERRGDLIGSDLRRYYVERQMGRDFVAFLKQHRIYDDRFVASLIAVEEAMEKARVRGSASASYRYPDPICQGEPLRSDDLLSANGSAFTLQHKLEAVVQALADGGDVDESGPTFYAARVNKDGGVRVAAISQWLAELLEASSPQRTIEQVQRRMASGLHELTHDLREDAIRLLVEGAHIDGWLSIYRPAPVLDRGRSAIAEARVGTL